MKQRESSAARVQRAARKEAPMSEDERRKHVRHTPRHRTASHPSTASPHALSFDAARLVHW